MAAGTTLAIPLVEIDDSAKVLLGSEDEVLLDRLIAELDSEARRVKLPVVRIEVSGFRDPEEGVEQVVVAQWVKSDAERALDFWDCVGDRIQRWEDEVTDSGEKAAAGRFAVEMHWS